MDQNELKRLVGKAALNYVKDGDVLGVGTGSTVDCFIDALAQSDIRPSACVSSSERSTKKLIELGFKVIDLSEVEEIGVYVDGADEINAAFEMIKGGGGALTREKIVASVAKTFVCIADESKLVKTLGKFPLPVEVIPMAVSSVARSLRKLGADPVERDFTTDNGCRILDCRDFMIDDPKAMEQTINALPGVVTVGLFAARGAQIAQSQYMVYVNAVFPLFLAAFLAAPHAELPRLVSADIDFIGREIRQELGVQAVHKIQGVFVRIQGCGKFSDSSQRVYKRSLAFRQMRVLRISQPPFHMPKPIHIRHQLDSGEVAQLLEAGVF